MWTNIRILIPELHPSLQGPGVIPSGAIHYNNITDRLKFMVYLEKQPSICMYNLCVAYLDNSFLEVFVHSSIIYGTHSHKVVM